jgi:hypothetical protein
VDVWKMMRRRWKEGNRDFLKRKVGRKWRCEKRKR